MTVETVQGTGHTVFRDDHAGFMDAVVGGSATCGDADADAGRGLL